MYLSYTLYLVIYFMICECHESKKSRTKNNVPNIDYETLEHMQNTLTKLRRLVSLDDISKKKFGKNLTLNAHNFINCHL